ncbi:MAG: hypothetical protein ACRYFX_28655 [Janthinobacterium lividum]
MKNILLIALLASATVVEASAQTPTQAGDQTPTQTGKTKKKGKYTAEMYKGTVAKQRRIVTEAAGAQKDKEDDDATSTSTSKSTKDTKKN